MTTIALPSFFANPRTCIFEPYVNQRSNASPFGGSEQVVDLLNDRWLATVSIPPRSKDGGAAVEAFIGAMRGMVNTINLYHLVRPVPRGTMRGAPVTDGAGQGANSLVVWTSAPGATLFAGDMIGAEGLLLMTAEDCVADGSGRMVVPLVNRLRKTVALNAAIVWDRPAAPFRLVSRPTEQYMPGYADGLTFDLAEAIV